MRRILLAVCLGLVVGAAGSFLAIERGWLPPGPVTSVIGAVPKISLVEAESHRTNRYESLRSVAAVLALPGDFAQTEALYALAGRSDSAAVQRLIFEASGIADPSDRDAALGILFARLTELDPPSALALSQTDPFAGNSQIETRIWQSWATLDLDTALGAAAGLDSASRRNLAAQALFAAYDDWGNAATRQIAAALDIEPDSRNRSRYLARLANADPAAAVEYIETINTMMERMEAADTLGRHLGRIDAGAAARVTALFEDAQLREVFSNALTRATIEIDPAATLDALLNDAGGPEQFERLLAAFRALAEQDIDLALGYLERVDNRQQRRSASMIVGQFLVQKDPERALEWSKEFDLGMRDEFHAQMLSTLAETDPERAIAEAQALTNVIERRNAFNAIAMTLSQHDPEKAIQMLGGIAAPAERRGVLQSIASNWIWQEPEAAVSWVLTLPDSERGELLMEAVFQLSQTDPDAAIRFLPRLDEENGRVWRTQIASSLATHRSVEEAQSFIAPYEGTDEYPDLLSAVISGLAQTDIEEAMRMVDRLPAGARKDEAYNNLIAQYAQVDPRQAAAALAPIADEETRANATVQVVAEWSRSEPEAARQWVDNLPRGPQRDAAIMALASEWEDMTLARQHLIESIGNGELQKQVVFSVVYRAASLDPERAEQILQDTHLSEQEKQEVRTMLQSIGERSEQFYLRGWSPYH